MKLIKRKIQDQIEAKLFSGKAIIIYGPRQVGKTTLAHELIRPYGKDALYLNCDEPDVRRKLTDKTSTELLAPIGPKKVVVLDEAQRVRNIGLTIKLLVDSTPRLQIIATGSSSFELSNRIAEPLTGRAWEFRLYPLSMEEVRDTRSRIEAERHIEHSLIFGMYPEVVLKPHIAEDIIRTIAKNYLYKDVLEYQKIKNPEVLEKLLEALAIQIGNEVSFTELASLLGIDKKTVSSYVRILEQAFIVFSLRPFSRNRRKELSKLHKIYFYDMGIRNALLNNFNPLTIRTDIGALWENFLISERVKYHANRGASVNLHFWRTWDGVEIDLIEEARGNLSAYEMKWSPRYKKIPRTWATYYPDASYQLIHKENYWGFIG